MNRDWTALTDRQLELAVAERQAIIRDCQADISAIVQEIERRGEYTCGPSRRSWSRRSRPSWSSSPILSKATTVDGGTRMRKKRSFKHARLSGPQERKHETYTGAVEG